MSAAITPTATPGPFARSIMRFATIATLLAAVAIARLAAATPAPSAADQETLRRALAADAAARPAPAAPLPAAASPTAPTFAATPPPPAASAAAGIPAGASRLLPDISLIFDTALAAFVGSPRQAGGHDPQANGFNLQQLELHLASAIDPYLDLQANIVFATEGVEVEEAYVRTLGLPGRWQVRAGQLLARAGRSNPTHPHAWKFVDQPLLNGKLFGSEGQRGLGAEASWLAPTPWYLELVVAAAMPDGACCALSLDGGEARGVQGPQHLVWNVRLEQFFDLGPRWMLLVGAGGLFGPHASGLGNRTDIWIGDLTLRHRDRGDQQRRALTWQTEAMWRRRQLPGRLLQDGGVTSTLVAQVALRWEAGLRGEVVTGVAGDPLDPTWTAARGRAAAQVTFYPSHFSRLRAQLAWDRRPAEARDGWAAFLALEGVIGSHGSHAF